MLFNADGYFDIDESLRIIGLETDFADLLMGIIDPSGNMIVGEGRLTYNGKDSATGDNTPPQINVLGYFFDGCPPQGKDKQHYSSITIIKHTDFSTPSLFRLLNENCSELEVRLTRYHAGGDSKRIGNAQPSFEILMKGANVRAISTLSSCHDAIPYDIVSFGFRQLDMTTRQQLKDGRMGPAHMCRLYPQQQADNRKNERRKRS